MKNMQATESIQNALFLTFSFSERMRKVGLSQLNVISHSPNNTLGVHHNPIISFAEFMQKFDRRQLQYECLSVTNWMCQENKLSMHPGFPHVTYRSFKSVNYKERKRRKNSPSNWHIYSGQTVVPVGFFIFIWEYTLRIPSRHNRRFIIYVSDTISTDYLINQTYVLQLCPYEYW